MDTAVSYSVFEFYRNRKKAIFERFNIGVLSSFDLRVEESETNIIYGFGADSAHF